MYKIIYMKADYEPWWQFDGWQEKIVEEYLCATKEACEQKLQLLLADFRQRFSYEELRKERFYAFWNEEECVYCDGCDEESQIYHGLIVREIREDS